MVELVSDEIAQAVARGYPTAKQRREWSTAQWDDYNRVNGMVYAQRQAYEAEQRELSPDRLKERIDTLEKEVRDLREFIMRGD